MSGPLLYNPIRASREELEAMLVARRDVVERLVADLVADAGKKTQRHWQLIGPRGSGKSHLTQLIALRLEAEHGWAVARLPEEHYQVGSVGDLLEQIVMRLEQVDVSPLADVSSADLEERALDRIRARRTATGKPVLVVIENLAILFERQLRDRRSQQRLRQILGKNPPFALVTTSTSYVDATVQHAAPFYDFFQVVTLDELTRDEVVTLIEARAAWDRAALDVRLPRVRARARAMAHFTGGNARSVLALYVALRAGATDELYAALCALLDERTPHYQARLAALAPQAAAVLTAVALSAPDQSPSDIARACRMPTNQLTAQLAKLEAAGLVRAVARGDDRRRRHYQVADRLMRIWLAWRERVTPDASLAVLAAFFERWYEVAARPSAARGAYASEPGPGWGRGAAADPPRGLPYSTAAEVRADPRRAARLPDELREAVELLLGPPDASARS